MLRSKRRPHPLARLVASAALAAILGVPLAASAGTAAVGDTLAPITLEDQHGTSRSVDARTKVVVFSRDMDGGDLLKAALADASGDALEAAGVAYVADISGMPGIIARLFAIPAMRDRPYPMLLDRDGEASAPLPSAEGKATVIRLDALEVEEVAHLASADEVRAALGLAPAAESE